MKYDNCLSRRTVLIRGMQLPAAGFVALAFGACDQNESAGTASSCVDADLLSQGELSLRKSLKYVENHENPNETCSQCAYFTAGQNSGCGNCQILNGPANSNGHCSSWSKRNS